MLKISVSFQEGLAVMEDIEPDMAFLTTSGRDWAERTARLATCAPDLDLFAEALVEREAGGWKITTKGRVIGIDLGRQAFRAIPDIFG